MVSQFIFPSALESQVDLDGDGALSLAEVQYAAFVHHGLSGSVVKQLFGEVRPFTNVVYHKFRLELVM